MPLLSFLFEGVLISLSGVMAPGPITAVTVGKGNESPHAGAFVAIGHGMIEVPLMLSIFFGFRPLLTLPYVSVGIPFVGGLFLLVMGIGMFRSMSRVEVSSGVYTQAPLLAGMLLSLGNPYFLIWWATVGATLIARSASFGMVAFFTFALLHWACDFLWCYSLSALSFKGGRVLGKGFQKVVFAACGGILLFFSGRFILEALRRVFV